MLYKYWYKWNKGLTETENFKPNTMALMNRAEMLNNFLLILQRFLIVSSPSSLCIHPRLNFSFLICLNFPTCGLSCGNIPFVFLRLVGYIWKLPSRTITPTFMLPFGERQQESLRGKIWVYNKWAKVCFPISKSPLMSKATESQKLL